MNTFGSTQTEIFPTRANCSILTESYQRLERLITSTEISAVCSTTKQWKLESYLEEGTDKIRMLELQSLIWPDRGEMVIFQVLWRFIWFTSRLLCKLDLSNVYNQATPGWKFLSYSPRVTSNLLDPDVIKKQTFLSKCQMPLVILRYAEPSTSFSFLKPNLSLILQY